MGKERERERERESGGWGLGGKKGDRGGCHEHLVSGEMIDGM
jgi:hypothetical protein